MIRVIGKDVTIMRCTCFNCGNILTYNRYDIEKKAETDYTDSIGIIRCPCGYRVAITET